MHGAGSLQTTDEKLRSPIVAGRTDGDNPMRDDSPMVSPKDGFVPKKNLYWCPACNRYTVTVDVAEGVTPMFLACRALGDITDPANTCRGRAQSLMYPPEPWPETDGFILPIPTEPKWEWYSPDGRERKKLRRREPSTFDHVERGGLLLRACA